ncbi:MAG: hypothetical protein H0U59_00365 [Gemmatimonadaceae bacterium]|nr:hypothetical protein [Gemmatimonadaceae bacterium]MDQ3243759.1 hypothetical protein [Gemmatimonadota bacterium]
MKTTTFRRPLVTALAIAGFVYAGEAFAQHTTPATPPAAKSDANADTRKDSGIALRDSVTIADVERAAEQLAVAVQAAVKKATESPELKLAALKVATNAITAAQVIVTQQAETLQAVLEAVARQISVATAQQAKPKQH